MIETVEFQDSGMNYFERITRPELRRDVQCLWDLSAPATSHPEVDRVVPDGCIELIVHWGDRVAEVRGSASTRQAPVRQPRTLVAGQRETPLLLLSLGRTGLTAARFTPGGAPACIRDRMDLFRHRTVDLEDVNVDARELPYRLAEADGPQERMAILEIWLVGCHQPIPLRLQRVESAVVEMRRNAGQCDIQFLAREAGCSRRTLERLFLERVGLTPRALAKILRIQSVLRRLHPESEVSWSGIAADCGYYDQSHLVRDFRRYTGMTPTAWQRQTHEFADLFLPLEQNGTLAEPGSVGVEVDPDA